VYLGYSLGALATLGLGHYMTKDGITSLKLSSDDIQLIAQGAVKGALHTENLDDILSCLDDPLSFIKDVEKAVSKFDEHDVSAGLFDIGLSFSALAKGIKDCDSDTTEREIVIFKEMLKSFEHPKSLAVTAGKNIAVNGVNIYKEMSAAFTNYRNSEFEGFGRDIGVALALIFIGAHDGTMNNQNPSAKQAAMVLVSEELYPTGVLGDSKKAYINYLDAVMREKEEAMSLPEDLVAVATPEVG
jgi:hypothetical protein